MNPNEKELWKALDQAVFGTLDPEGLDQGMDRVREQYDKERSSLGNFLTSLREQEEATVEDMARAAGVSNERWREWEMDFATPSVDELLAVARRLGWRERKLDIATKLRLEAPRYRLTRLTYFRPEMLAARGGLNRGGLVWSSIDEATRERICQWGAERGHAFPAELGEFVKGLSGEDGSREAWIDEVLGG